VEPCWDDQSSVEAKILGLLFDADRHSGQLIIIVISSSSVFSHRFSLDENSINITGLPETPRVTELQQACTRRPEQGEWRSSTPSALPVRRTLHRACREGNCLINRVEDDPILNFALPPAAVKGHVNVLHNCLWDEHATSALQVVGIIGKRFSSPWNVLVTNCAVRPLAPTPLMTKAASNMLVMVMITDPATQFNGGLSLTMMSPQR
jgi:hypothetical protein